MKECCDRDPWYTVPFIHDQLTGVVMSDSSDIVRYLDKQYPSSPRVVTPGTLAFEAAYYKYFIAGVWSKWPRPIHQYMYETISPESAAFIKELREAAFGDTLVNIAKNPLSHWDAYKDAFGSVALPIYEKAEGIFLKGNEPAWADFVTSSSLLSIKLLYGVGSEEWKYIETWHDGRWAKLIKDLEPYAYIDE
jgi:glutathione S-transferase